MSLKDYVIDTKDKDIIVEKLLLLEKYKVLQDKIWKRIWLTELETVIMDSEQFQRLHWKLQLGTTIFVYPCASHTRFEHSTGALEAAELIIRACNRNSRRYSSYHISLYEHFLARLAALLHDLAQLAFGHTLDSEGHIFNIEWDNPFIANKLISKRGIIPNLLQTYLKEKWNALPPKISKIVTVNKFVEFIRSDLEWIFQKGLKHSNEEPKNDYLLFISDIVGNTLSGDLLDYVQRDYISLGLGHDPISLIPLEFVVIKEIPYVGGEKLLPRLVVTLWKPSKPEKMRKDVWRYIVALFDRRCTLAEDVYYHHAKAAASAMLIKAVHLSKMGCKELWNCGDIEVLDMLANWEVDTKTNDQNEEETIQTSLTNEPAKKIKSLASYLLKRHLFKNIFEANLATVKEHRRFESITEKYCNKKDGAKNQRDFEKTLISYFPCISDEQIAVYCPDPNMNLKPFETLIWETKKQPVKSLDAISDAKSIKNRHKDLWSFKVFIDPDVFKNDKMKLDLLKNASRQLLLEKTPRHQLSLIWLENYGPELEDIAHRNGTKFFSKERKLAEAALVTMLNDESRSKKGEYDLKAPLPREVYDIVVSKEKNHEKIK